MFRTLLKVGGFSSVQDWGKDVLFAFIDIKWETLTRRHPNICSGLLCFAFCQLQRNTVVGFMFLLGCL